MNAFKLFGATLKDYPGDKKEDLISVYSRDAMILNSELYRDVSPAFPELNGAPMSTLNPSVTIKAPILDIGAMKDGFKERMQFIQLLDPKRSNIAQFPFWEAFGFWLRAAEKWPFKHDNINITFAAVENVLFISNPLRYEFSYKLEFPASTLSDDSTMFISKSLKFYGSDPILRDHIQDERTTSEKELYIRITNLPNKFDNVSITFNKKVPKSVGNGDEKLKIDTRPFRKQFIEEITEFATQWSNEDTEDLKERVPQSVLESKTSEEAFEFSKTPFKGFSTNVIRMRLLMMQYFNKIVEKKLPEVPEEMWRSSSHYLSHDFAIKEIMKSFKMAPEKYQFKTLELDRLKAQRRILDGSGTADDSLISQIGRQIKEWPLDALRIRPGERIWRVGFVGEQAIDAGGPTKEALSQGCSSIFEKSSYLTVPTPNGREKHGPNSEFFLPFTTNQDRDNDYWAIGNILCVIIRSGFNQDLPFASVFWKFLAHEPITENDFTSIEKGFDDTVKALRKTKADGTFARQNEWTTTDFDGNVVVLPGKQKGQIVEAIQVEQYIKECVQYKFDLIRRPMEIIRNAFEENNGVNGHKLYTGRLLSRMIQGTQTISVSEMKSITSYSVYTENDNAIKYFWKAVERLTQEQLKLLLMFQTTLTRLPNRNVQSVFILEIDKLSASRPDETLPTASTCFNRLHLPQYTSEKACYEKLVYAITYCQTMDNS
jgi:hypothetical protein